MRKGRFTEAQVIGMIKEQEAGMPTVEVCRRHGLSTATFYKLNRLLKKSVLRNTVLVATV